MMTRTYIFAGGGTGGHLFPGIAVAQELVRREPEARILFVGSERELERSILAQYRFEHRSLPVESLQALVRHPVRFAVRNWRAWRNARKLIREEHPSVVIGLGGFASAPVVWAASRQRIPVILLEQNVIPGRTTRWLARSASELCLAFSEAADHLPPGTTIHVTGNPVRSRISGLRDEAIQIANVHHRQLLILGGSQGAESLNDAVIEAARLLNTALADWRVVHQAGARQADAVRQAYRDLNLSAVVEPFFDDLASHYQSASLVVSRAGATTLAEVACCGLPMILLPYPNAADAHQLANAKVLQKCGGAIIVEHRATAKETGLELAAQLRSLLEQPERLPAMSDAVRKLARPDATSIVTDRIQSLSKH